MKTYKTYKKVKHEEEPKKWFINKETGEQVKATWSFIRKRLLTNYPAVQARRMMRDWREATLSEQFDLECHAVR